MTSNHSPVRPRCDACQYCWPHEELDGENNYVWAKHCNLALAGGKTIVKEEDECHPAWCPLLVGDKVDLP